MAPMVRSERAREGGERSARRSVVVAVVAVVALGGGAFAVHRYAAKSASEPPIVLPTFTEVPPGPRAPSRDVLGGLAIGRSTLADVEAFARARNLTCKDTSARALMRDARAKKKAEAEARGVDVTTSASGKWSPLESNPQVRLSCEGTRAGALDDRPRPPSEGRVLFLLDSPSHPLRHVSYRRVHHDEAAALSDARDARSAMEARFGPPATKSGELPSTEAGTPIFEPYAPIRAEWRWADLRAEVSVLSFGARGVDVYEAVEVPWPIRSDSPDPGTFARGAKE